MDQLVEEFGQNIANLEHLFRGGLQALISFRDHQSMQDELKRAQGKVKLLTSQYNDQCQSVTLLHGNYNKLNADWRALQASLTATEKKLSESRALQTQVELAAADAKAEVILKNHIIESCDRDL